MSRPEEEFRGSPETQWFRISSPAKKPQVVAIVAGKRKAGGVKRGGGDAPSPVLEEGEEAFDLEKEKEEYLSCKVPLGPSGSKHVEGLG